MIPVGPMSKESKQLEVSVATVRSKDVPVGCHFLRVIHSGSYKLSVKRPTPPPGAGRFRVRSISSGCVPENCQSGYTDPAYGGRGPLLRAAII